MKPGNDWTTETNALRTYSHWGAQISSAPALPSVGIPPIDRNFEWKAVLAEHFCSTETFPLKSCGTILIFNSNDEFVWFLKALES